MADLRTDLIILAARVPATTAEVVDADVARGRTTVRRRRTATTSAAGAAVAAVLVTGAVLTTTTGAPVDPMRVPVAAGGPAGGATTTTAAAVLAPPFVPTVGTTSGPFNSTLAPEGWVVQDPNDTYGLRLTDPTRPAGDLAPLTLTLLSLDATPPTAPAPLLVNGNPAWIHHDDQRLPQDQVHTLITRLPDGRYLQVDYANAVGWTDEQVLGFTAGITVASDAPRTQGRLAPRHRMTPRRPARWAMTPRFGGQAPRQRLRGLVIVMRHAIAEFSVISTSSWSTPQTGSPPPVTPLTLRLTEPRACHMNGPRVT